MKTETRQTRLLIKFADPTVFLFIYVSLQIPSALTREQMKSGALKEPPRGMALSLALSNSGSGLYSKKWVQ